MDSSVSLEDRIWFLRVCHHVPFSLYFSWELHRRRKGCKHSGRSNFYGGAKGLWVLGMAVASRNPLTFNPCFNFKLSECVGVFGSYIHGVIDCNEWETEKRQECANLGKLKRLDL